MCYSIRDAVTVKAKTGEIYQFHLMHVFITRIVVGEEKSIYGGKI